MPVTKSKFTTAEAAKIFDLSQSAFKVWRQRGICSFGEAGKVWSFSWIEMLKIGTALSLKAYGIDLKKAFQITDKDAVHRQFAAQIVGYDAQSLFLYYVFDPATDTKKQGRSRMWTITHIDDDSFGFDDPQTHEIPTEATLKVDLRLVADRWLGVLEQNGCIPEPGEND